MPTFTDGELQTLFNGNWLLQGNSKGNVVPWHNHFNTFWQFDRPSNVSRVEVELWTVVGEEWRVTAPFFLGHNVDFTLEFLVSLDGTWGSQYLTTFDLVVGNTTEQNPNVVPGFTKVKGLVEHFNPSNSGLENVFLQTNDFNFVTDLNSPTVNPTRSNRPTTSDREDVFNWHHEWLVSRTLWSWDVFINHIQQV